MIFKKKFLKSAFAFLKISSLETGNKQIQFEMVTAL